MPQAAIRLVHSANDAYDDQYIEDLRGLVWNSQSTSHKTWTILAADANLSIGTVARFASGETKKPHFLTIQKLLKALGIRFALVPIDAPRQRDERAVLGMRNKRPGH